LISEALPDVPTVGEFVPGYEASVWLGLGAPTGTPAEIIDKLNQETNAALADPKIKARNAQDAFARGGGAANNGGDRWHIGLEPANPSASYLIGIP
jgi:tripartite-type tricarboxylate transporter receptor subunit TctC